MKEAGKIILIIIVILAVAAPFVFNMLIREMGTNFVHDKPSTPEYYEHVQNRIFFSAISRGEKFDSLLTTWMQQNPPYGYYDTAGTGKFRYDTCHCDCFPLKRLIYFPDNPTEVYLITYEYGDIRGGIIDIVYTYRNNGWSCQKSSQIDSAEKVRIENRLENEIIKKLKL